MGGLVCRAFLQNLARFLFGDVRVNVWLDIEDIRVPDYEIERRLWVNEHYEGGYLYRNSIILEMVPPRSAREKWKVTCAWQDSGVAAATTEVDAEQLLNNSVEVAIDFESHTTGADGKPCPTNPGVKGKLRFVIAAWNAAHG